MPCDDISGGQHHLILSEYVKCIDRDRITLSVDEIVDSDWVIYNCFSGIVLVKDNKLGSGAACSMVKCDFLHEFGGNLRL